MNTAFHSVQPAGRRFWLAHVEALAENGFSRSEYCRRHHLPYHALTYWVCKPCRLVKPTSLHTLVEVPAGHVLPMRRAETEYFVSILAAGAYSKSSPILIKLPCAAS